MTNQQIRVDFSGDIDTDHPKCIHGPTLLFYTSTEKFFACSACRDRRQCDIFIPYDDRTKKSSKKIIEQNEREYQRFREHIQTLQKNRTEFFKHSSIHYCYTCSLLFPAEQQSDHVNHQQTKSLVRRQLRQPCQDLLTPLENKRTNAQYFFSSNFLDYLINQVIMKNSFDSVICIGCPTIFERIRNKLPSYLLDYDTRFCSFYPRKQFLVYNMFNGHIFSDEKYFRETFLPASQNCLIIVDPPFGGLHRALAYSLNKLPKANLILFNPYFLEKWLVDAFPNLRMLDYKIEYTPQSSFHLCRGQKGSPVRMFTNISPSIFPPLDDINYKYCLECDRYTLINNQHCYQCQTCPSKDGLPSRHCSICQRCVKSKQQHCDKCHVCHLPGQCRPSSSNESMPKKRRKI